MKQRRTQNFYKQLEDFDYYSAQKTLHDSPHFTCNENKCGLHGKFRGTDVLYQISPNGIVQITYSNDEDKVRCFNLLQGHLKRKLIPDKLHAWNIPYRALAITFSWCKEKITYIRRLGFWNYLKWRRLHNEKERDREIRELEADGYYLLEKMMMNEDEWTPEKDAQIKKKYRELFGLS